MGPTDPPNILRRLEAQEVCGVLDADFFHPPPPRIFLDPEVEPPVFDISMVDRLGKYDDVTSSPRGTYQRLQAVDEATPFHWPSLYPNAAPSSKRSITLRADGTRPKNFHSPNLSRRLSTLRYQDLTMSAFPSDNFSNDLSYAEPPMLFFIPQVCVHGRVGACSTYSEFAVGCIRG